VSITREAIRQIRRGIPVTALASEDLIRFVPPDDLAHAFLQSLPEPELLTALDCYARGFGGPGHPRFAVYLEHVFRERALPYAVSVIDGISWVGEPAVRQEAIEPALSALADPRLADARKEFDDAREELRRGKLKDAATSAGRAVETTLAVLLEQHGGQQPMKHGNDLVQAGALFDALKAKDLRVLNQGRDHALVYAAIEVRHACAHGAGANPTPIESAYVEAGVGAAAVAIAYLASKLPP
jgi:hypothetical protein